MRAALRLSTLEKDQEDPELQRALQESANGHNTSHNPPYENPEEEDPALLAGIAASMDEQ